MIIRRFIFGLVAMACVGAYAQSETTALSVAVKIAQNSVCDPSMNCESVSKSSYAVSHSFEISPAQLAMINADTTVSHSSAMKVKVRLGDDPNYQPGDESATVDGTAELPYPVECQVKLSWKNGIFTISAKGKESASESSTMLTSSETVSKLSATALPPGHAANTVSSETKLEDSGGAFAMSTGYAAYKGGNLTTLSPAADGMVKGTAQLWAKTKNLVSQPVF